MRWLTVVLVVAFAGAEALAGNTYVSFVPWKVLGADESPEGSAFSLYWIPASHEDFRRSELHTSRELTLYASQCVGMHVVRPDDRARIDELEAGDELPVAILFDRDGAEIARAENDRGVLRPSAVERIVREALDARAAAAEAILDEARRAADEGDVDAALAMYRHVWDERCTCPRQAKDAKRAMRKLKK